MKREVWNAKYAIAESILPILINYRQSVYKRELMSMPTWVLEPGEDLSENEMNSRWLLILDAMIQAFELDAIGHNFSIEKKEKIQKLGLDYFCKYYPHLWD